VSYAPGTRCPTYAIMRRSLRWVALFRDRCERHKRPPCCKRTAATSYEKISLRKRNRYGKALSKTPTTELERLNHFRDGLECAHRIARLRYRRGHEPRWIRPTLS